MICRSTGQLVEAVAVLRDCAVTTGWVLVPPAHASTMLALSPEAQCGPERMLPGSAARIPAIA